MGPGTHWKKMGLGVKKVKNPCFTGQCPGTLQEHHLEHLQKLPQSYKIPVINISLYTKKGAIKNTTNTRVQIYLHAVSSPSAPLWLKQIC